MFTNVAVDFNNASSRAPIMPTAVDGIDRFLVFIPRHQLDTFRQQFFYRRIENAFCDNSWPAFHASMIAKTQGSVEVRCVDLVRLARRFHRLERFAASTCKRYDPRNP
jgi:hypothetical protein